MQADNRRVGPMTQLVGRVFGGWKVVKVIGPTAMSPKPWALIVNLDNPLDVRRCGFAGLGFLEKEA